MASSAKWNESGQSEGPAAELLQKLGYSYVSPEKLEEERESLKDVILAERLKKALKRLNPWLSDDNLHKAIRAIANVQKAGLMEANEAAHIALTYGISLEQNLGDGKKSHTVRFIDFNNPKNNEFLVTRQFKVKGAKKHVIADLVCFINGIPLVIIECKSPTLGDKWFHEAVDQVQRYQENDSKYQELGAPRLFHAVQLIVVTCGQSALYGAVGTKQNFYSAWKVPYPLTVEQVAKKVGKDKPDAQEVLFYGLLTPDNILDLIQNFVVFERDISSGKIIKKIPRYQQFMAVNKAIERARQTKEADKRGGVIWHTQGSGKSLTMMWLALKLRRDPLQENPTIVLVTDRRDLDTQITNTFRACGFPNPEQAESVKDLRGLLFGPGGRTVMTTVQKFQEIGGIMDAAGKRINKPKYKVLREASNVFVLTDEAHRSQYGSLAGNLRLALPNAVFFGFTGTPIDKKNRSTLKEFGPYIDQYTIEQAVADEATVPIFYEGRMPELHIIGQSLDKVFDRVFADRSDEEKAAIKRKYATEQAVAEAPKRIEAICLDIIDHYIKYVEPNGFKAQVVTVSREAAVTYKNMFDKLNAPKSVVVFTGAHNDEKRLADHHTDPDKRKEIIKAFLKKDDDLKLLIVVDMLLTGFDAPIEQVMYLDSPLREHTLLQAIARVNRKADKKTHGLVVDYWGVSEDLQEALAIFSPTDIKGALEPKGEELPRLQSRHAAAMRFFGRVKDKGDLNECVNVLEPEDVRSQFQTAFRRFSQSMDMMLPDPRAMEYSGDLAWLGKIRQAAAARFRDDTLDISDCGEKVRRLIEEAVIAGGIEILVKPVSLFSGDFKKKLDALKSDEAKASEMEHAIRAEIHVKLEENPAFYMSLRETLEKIIEDRKARRIDAAKQLELLNGLILQVKGHDKAAENEGLTETAFAIYGLLKDRDFIGVAESQPEYKSMVERAHELASVIETAVEPHVNLVDWTAKNDVQREMRRQIKRRLPDSLYPKPLQEKLAAAIIDLMRVRRGK